MPITESNAPVPMPEPVKLQLQKVILPIIATANDGGFHPIGTGFINCAIGREAIASMLWPSMGIAIKEAMLDGVVGQVKLLDLQQRNFVDDKGNASEHISFVPGTRINDCQMIWR